MDAPMTNEETKRDDPDEEYHQLRNVKTFRCFIIYDASSSSVRRASERHR